MKNRWVYILFLMVLLSGLSACATKGIDPTDTGDLSISIHDSEDVNIANVYVRQFESEILIHADAKPTSPVRFFKPGHLIFEMIGSDGQQLFNLDVTHYSRKHGESHRSKLKHVSFWVRMPMELPKGASLIVSHHKKKEHNKER